MLDWVIKYWVGIAFGGIVTLIGFLYKVLNKRLKEQDAMKMGIQAMLRDRLIQAYNYYEEKGYCPIYARENLKHLHEQYRALGGNGMVEDLVTRIQELPTHPGLEGQALQHGCVKERE